MTQIIPNYILKIIFKLIIGKNYDFIDVKSISLISWDWFKFIGEHTNFKVLIDNNKQFRIPSKEDNENKYLLIKPKSVKYLQLISISKLNTQLINKVIKEFNNLKWIYVEHNNPNVYSMLNFKSFRINSIRLDGNNGGGLNTNNNHLQSYIKKVDELYITSNINTTFLLSLFNQSKVYGIHTKIDLSYHQFNIYKFPFSELFNKTINRLQWLNYINLNIITPKILNGFLKSSPRIKYLSFGICFHNLIYNLYNNGKNNLDSTIKPCDCHNSDMDESLIWNECCSIISNHKYLNNLEIYDKCFKNHLIDYSNRYYDDMSAVEEVPLKSTLHQNQPWANSFIQMFTTNNSINSLTLDFIQFSQMIQIVDPLIKNLKDKLSRININYYIGSLLKVDDVYDYKESNLLKIKKYLLSTGNNNNNIAPLEFLKISSYNNCMEIDGSDDLIFEEGVLINLN